MRLLRKFGLEVGFVRAAHARAGWIPPLRHEPGDDPVEGHTVVKAVAGEVCNALDMSRGQVWPKLDDDVAAGGKGEGEALAIGHEYILCLGVGLGGI